MKCFLDSEMILKTVFNHYVNLDTAKKNRGGKLEHGQLSKYMSQSEFLNFGAQCGFIPDVMSREQMLSTFKSMVREDIEFGDQPPNMINYTPQFLQALVKIALHHKQNRDIDKNQQKQEYHK